MGYTLAIVSLFRNGALFLKEWLEFHLMVGVEHFYLCDHLSTDNSLEILNPYIEAGVVELENDTRNYSSIFEFEHLIHMPFFEQTISRTRGIVQWLACLDVDEFMIPAQGKDIKELLPRYMNYDSISLNWQVYGTSRLENVPSNSLLIESLNRRLPCTHSSNYALKVIVQPTRVHGWMVHWLVHGRSYQTDETLCTGPHASKVVLDELYINHYSDGTLSYFREIKVPFYLERQSFNELMERAYNGHNHIQDLSMRRWSSQLRLRMFGKPDIPVDSISNYEVSLRNEFDSNWYLSTYPDLEAVADLHGHWLVHGRGECRPPNARSQRLQQMDFDPVWYYNYYPDLKENGILLENTRLHWQRFGYLEARAPSLRYLRNINSDFDGSWYQSHYPDLIALDGELAIWQHWESYGLIEGRQPNSTKI